MVYCPKVLSARQAVKSYPRNGVRPMDEFNITLLLLIVLVLLIKKINRPSPKDCG